MSKRAIELDPLTPLTNIWPSGDPIHIGMIYDGLGEHEKAIGCLLKAYEIRSGQIIYLKAFSDSFFKDISSDPRYIDLLKKIGFEVN